MKIIKGNLLEYAKKGMFDIIVQGCNCHHTMGGGIAFQIREQFPEAYEADLQTKKSDPRKLGTYSFVRILPDKKRGILKEFTIINAYTQFDFGTDSRKVEYGAIRSVFKQLNTLAKKQHTIGLPKIGAGLAQGNWSVIKDIIEDEIKFANLILVEYNKGI